MKLNHTMSGSLVGSVTLLVLVAGGSSAIGQVGKVGSVAGGTSAPLQSAASAGTTRLAAGSVSGGGVATGKAPAAPARPMVLPYADGGYRVSWIDAATDEAGYEIERQPAFSGGVRRVAANSTELIDLEERDSVQYRVRAVGDGLSSVWSSWLNGTSMASGFAALKPGNGFTGPTAQPAAVGEQGMPGFNARAIARWDVVPMQSFGGTMHVGVVAFHMNGIDRVEFSVNGGAWVPVREMQLNPRTNVWEYTALLRASDFRDGPIEIRAVAYPMGAGEARVLEPLMLNANPSGTPKRAPIYVSASRGNDATGKGTKEQPFASVWPALQSFGANANLDGLVVYLEAGSYTFGGDRTPRPVTSQGWITLTPAPGVERSSVVFNQGGRFRVRHVHLKDVTLDLRNGSSLGNFPTIQPEIWLDRVVAIGPGPAAGTDLIPPAGWANIYVTDTESKSFRDGIEFGSIVRNVRLSDLGSDAFSNSRLVINSSVDNVRIPPGKDFHPDIFQFSGTGTTRDNTIVYGLRATNINAQGIFADDLARVDNAAFVNVLLQRSSGSGAKSQWKDVASNHVLFWNCTWIDQPFAWRASNVTNVSIVGCSLAAIEGNTTLVGSGGTVDLRHNHVVVPPVGAFGTDLTTGNPGWVGSGAWPYAPAKGSVLSNRLPRSMVPSDARGGLRPSQADWIGAFATAESNGGK